MWFRSATQVMRIGADKSIASLKEAGNWRVREAPTEVSGWPLPKSIGSSAITGACSAMSISAAWAENRLNFPLLTITDDSVDGNVLLIVPAGLIRISSAASSIAPEPLPWPSDDAAKVRRLWADHEGNLWVGTIASGLIRFRRAPLTAYGSREGLADVGFNAVFQDREGVTWLGGDVLYRSDRDGFHLVPGVTNLRAIAQTRDGDLWFGGYGGLRAGDRASWTLRASSRTHRARDI
jgi:hypothetical protein